MKMKHKVMVCVTRQKTCERLIRAGADIARAKSHELLVVHAIHPDQMVMGSTEESQALEDLFSLANSFGGEMAMLRAEDTLQALTNCAKNNKVRTVVMGVSPQGDGKGSIVEKLRENLPGVNIIAVPAEGE